jgi:hypothetical protein
VALDHAIIVDNITYMTGFQTAPVQNTAVPAPPGTASGWGADVDIDDMTSMAAATILMQIRSDFRI